MTNADFEIIFYVSLGKPKFSLTFFIVCSCEYYSQWISNGLPLPQATQLNHTLSLPSHWYVAKKDESLQIHVKNYVLSGTGLYPKGSYMHRME